RRQTEDQHATEQVVPEVTNPGRVKQNQDERLRDQRRDKHRRAANKAKKERDEKHAENTAVENRADNVDRLDKVLDQVGQERERNGDTAPRSGEQFRDEKIMI